MKIVIEILNAHPNIARQQPNCFKLFFFVRPKWNITKECDRWGRLLSDFAK